MNHIRNTPISITMYYVLITKEPMRFSPISNDKYQYDILSCLSDDFYYMITFSVVIHPYLCPVDMKGKSNSGQLQRSLRVNKSTS